MPQLEHIDAIERRLWSAADTLRANSKYASNEYFLPVMGLVFLRHAYSRYLAVRDEIEAGLPTRRGRKRAVTRADFARKNALFLRPEAQFDTLVALPDGADRAAAIGAAMESIEEDYDGLRGVLPKSEYQALDNEVLGDLLRKLNPDELKQVSGDVFGRIYEYFLTKFADQKAHDDGEFFTPVSLVSLIAHVLDPDRGTVLDPACGSGGMFVQSARTVEEHGASPAERLTFRGVEKNDTTIRLAKMNLAVHGLEGQRFLDLVLRHLEDAVGEGLACFRSEGPQDPIPQPAGPLPAFIAAVGALRGMLSPFLRTRPKRGRQVRPARPLAELDDEHDRFESEAGQFLCDLGDASATLDDTSLSSASLNSLVKRLAPLAERSRELARQADQLYKAAARLIETCEQRRGVGDSDAWNARTVTRARKAADEARGVAVAQLQRVRHFWRQAHWLTERFPDGELRDVAGLVKLVDRAEIEAHDWSLTPGRYVGVAPEEEDEDFDFPTAMREIHAELADLNAEAAVLAARIQKNFEKLGI